MVNLLTIHNNNSEKHNDDDENNNNNNRPDIVLIIDIENKLPLLIDIAVHLTHNLPKTEREKITKYENLALGIKNIW
jgi:hypothetical protein